MFRSSSRWFLVARHQQGVFLPWASGFTYHRSILKTKTGNYNQAEITAVPVWLHNIAFQPRRQKPQTAVFYTVSWTTSSSFYFTSLSVCRPARPLAPSAIGRHYYGMSLFLTVLTRSQVDAHSWPLARINIKAVCYKDQQRDIRTFPTCWLTHVRRPVGTTSTSICGF